VPSPRFVVAFYVYFPELYAIEFGWNGLRIPGEQPTYEITKGTL
jgi:3,4-dihydroxy-9,10-secoandrosta-1,3,5(10)-triene-9,17-dione 4,5-dioxygenase